MKRRTFIRNTALVTAGALISARSFSRITADFPLVRIAPEKRNFASKNIEAAIQEFKSSNAAPELKWLFENCFPNTLDTTVEFSLQNNRPDTYVITGDIDAMWLRDSTAQVWPYLQFMIGDRELQQLIAGVINRQAACILKDPYANAFYKDENKISEWKSDRTKMLPGVHERKWEIDSLCYPVRLAYHYWKATNDVAPFGTAWLDSIRLILQTFREQQRKENLGPYKFQRRTENASDTMPPGGYGYPVKPIGLICSSFRPSDDATLLSFLIPSNFFAVASLRQAAEMVTNINKDKTFASELRNLANEVEKTLQEFAIVNHPRYGKVYAYEIDGFGSHLLMDDANVPSLLSMPYLGVVNPNDDVYVNTRKLVWSENNPFFFRGKAGEGIGGPHVGFDMIWPLGITMRGLTSTSDSEIKNSIDLLRTTHAGTGFMHESFHKDDASKFTRKWFAWANTMFGEFMWKVYKERPRLLV